MLVLGINAQHDSGAALVRDGEILAAVNEERLNRKKLFWGPPILSVQAVLDIANVRPSEIDLIGVSNLFTGNRLYSFEDAARDPNSLIIQELSRVGLGRGTFGAHWLINLIRQLYGKWMSPSHLADDAIDSARELGCTANVKRVDHHIAHVASTYYSSGWSKGLFVSHDAAGDGYCGRVMLGRDGKLIDCDRTPFYHSLAYYYAYITHILGFIASRHEGKVTGLAAHGKGDDVYKILKDMISYDRRTGTFINRGGYLTVPIQRLRRLLKSYSREEVAAGIQCLVETEMTQYIELWVKRTGIELIGLSGGLFANVRLNQKVREIPGVKSVYIHPHMGDGGLGVGAALYAWAQEAHQEGSYQKPQRLRHAYLGPDYTDADIEETLTANEKLIYWHPDNINQEVAQFLAEGKVVARFDGRMEYGPRALGNRSILYQANDPSVNEWLNKRLKRTEFMPFAPILCIEDAPLYLKNINIKEDIAAEFMAITYEVTDRCKKEAPAIVHVDATARPQVVRPEVNPSLYDILARYKMITGLSVLINTSFNMHEEPIVCSPQDAVRAFCDSQLDCLALGPFLVQVKE